jgi:hypothetical protein
VEQFSYHFVLLLDLCFKSEDLTVLCVIGSLALPLGLKGYGSVLGSLLLPCVKLRWMESKLVTEIGNGCFVNQMPQNDRGFLLRGKSASRSGPFENFLRAHNNPIQSNL